MIQVILTSKISNRTVKKDYTARQLLDSSEDEIIDEMTACGCTQLHESGFDPCSCGDEWEEYELVLKGRDEKY